MLHRNRTFFLPITVWSSVRNYDFDSEDVPNGSMEIDTTTPFYIELSIEASCNQATLKYGALLEDKLFEPEVQVTCSEEAYACDPITGEYYSLVVIFFDQISVGICISHLSDTLSYPSANPALTTLLVRTPRDRAPQRSLISDGQWWERYICNDRRTQSLPGGISSGTIVNAKRSGPTPIGHLNEGDYVEVEDGSFQPILWMQNATVPANEDIIHIPARSINNDRELLLKADHRILLENWRVSLRTRHSGILIAVTYLEGWRGIKKIKAPKHQISRLLFSTHNLIKSQGARIETLAPCDVISCLDWSKPQDNSILNAIKECSLGYIKPIANLFDARDILS